MPKGGDAVADLTTTLIEMERQWALAYVGQDPKPLETIIADDFVGIESDGSVYDKKALLLQVASPEAKLLSNEVGAVKLRLFGDVAVLQGSETFTRRTGAKLETGRFVWTDVMAKRAGRWQIVAAQDNEVGP